MNNRFIRIGDLVIAINHITAAQRSLTGDVEVWLESDPEAITLYASDGGAEMFWSWVTSAMNCTALREKQEAGVLAQV